MRLKNLDLVSRKKRDHYSYFLLKSSVQLFWSIVFSTSIWHICNSFTYYQSIIFPNTIITKLSLSPDFWRDCLILAQCLETCRTKVKVDLDVLQLDCPHSTIAFHGVNKSCLGVLREAPQWESWRRRSTDLFSINMMKYMFWLKNMYLLNIKGCNFKYHMRGKNFHWKFWISSRISRLNDRNSRSRLEAWD